MGQKPQNPLALGFMEKIRPNIYRLTPLGRAVANRLRSSGPAPASDEQSELYRFASDLTHHPALVAWRSDPDQPRYWADAAAFLAKGGDVRRDAHKCLTAPAAAGPLGDRLVHGPQRDVSGARDAGRAANRSILGRLPKSSDFLQSSRIPVPGAPVSSRPAAKASK